MSIRTSPWPAGTPCWADLTVPDLEAAKAFYGAVLGWEFQQFGEEFGGYALARAKGAAAAGVGPQQAGTTPSWTLYLASDNVDSTAEAIGENGGTVVLPPGDVGPLGRLLIATDPTGAAFGVWQAGHTIGAEITNEPGGLVWEDLRSPDPDAARAFYQAVFGYRTDPLDAAGPDYHTFAHPSEQAPLGGMGGMFSETDRPAHWLVYFGVADVDAAISAATDAGGHVVQVAFDSPYGRMAGLTDPGGALFWVSQPTGELPDRSG
jgi:predicted enzyme related to lactoylglutathione lyase